MFSMLAARFLLFQQFFSSVRQRGIGRTVQIAFFELWYERKLGADTSYIIPKDRLDFDDTARAHSNDYFPSSYLVLREALVGGPVDTRGKVFVDFGCGGGRALLFASTLPLKRIIGVELSPTLCARAAENMRRYYASSGKSLPEWTVVQADVCNFVVPDDASIFYFFNPFDAMVLEAVVDNIGASLRRAPRQAFVVYAKPVHENVLSNRGMTRLASVSSDVAIYAVNRLT